MNFVQLVEYRTRRIDEMEALMEEWEAATEGRRTATRLLHCADRDAADTFVEIVEFPSYEDAMRNSNLPETTEISDRMAKLCDEGPTFRNLDVRRTLPG